MKTAILASAALAGLAAAAIAAPAHAQSSVSFGISVGSRGYYDPYYGGYAPYYDDYGYSRAARRACRSDPICSGRGIPYGYGYGGGYGYGYPAYAPPPTVVYEDRSSYDPLPRWRSEIPQQAPGYTYDLYGAYPQGDARAYGDATPPAQNGAVRYDLARQGYSASDFPTEYQSGAYQAGAQPYGSGGAVRYDTIQGGSSGNGAAESYIRGGATTQTPDDLLLGGPR